MKNAAILLLAVALIIVSVLAYRQTTALKMQLASGAVSDSSSPVAAQSASANSAPTATEVFRLRSECAALGQSILDDNIVGSALTRSVTTHYNPTTNRCYVDLFVQPADLSAPTDSYASRTLFDGQTREILAWTSVERGTKTGMLMVALETGVQGSTSDYDTVNAVINEMMADDRKR